MSKHHHPSNKAERRNHQKRYDHKAKALRRQLFDTEEGWHRHRHNRQACSCYMCGNPRKFNNERTIQERRNEQEYEARAAKYYSH